VESGETVSYKQLDERSNQCAALLRGLGMEIGDTVAICMDNTPYYFEICWAAQRAGLYFTCISSRLTAPEVAYIIKDSNAKVVFISRSQQAIAAELAIDLNSSCRLFAVDAPIQGYENYLPLRNQQETTPIEDETAGVEMLYSSGTTGKPKGIMTQLSGAAIDVPSALTLLLESLYHFDQSSIYLSPAPLYHSAPLRYNMAVQRFGGTCIVMEKFDAELALNTIEAYRITHSQWVPTMFVRMLKLAPAVRDKYDLSTMQVAIHAAAPCPKEIKRQLLDWWGPIIHEYYAGTEANGFTALNSEEWLANPGSVGKCVMGEVHIVDDNDYEVPAGEQGAIYFTGGADFSYHNAPEKTAESRNSKGWSTLGDIGYVNKEGYLFLTDRKANMIISGGVNLYPQETENLLVSHPKVMDVAVFGVPNSDYGEEVKAVVQPMDMAQASDILEAELIDFCRQKLSSLKAPRSIDFSEELPRHPNGKLYKRLLKDKYWGKKGSRII
jgi:long-chain acyl-CoA synthetase